MTTTISTSTTSQLVLTSTGSLVVTAAGAISTTQQSAIAAPSGFAAITNAGHIELNTPNTRNYVINSGGPAGSITNSGTIAGANGAISIDGNLDQLTNSGLISGITEIYVTGNATILNTNTGTISDNAGSLYIGGTATITNQGIISATASGYGAIKLGGAHSVVTNSGTIQGMDGTALSFASGSDTLVIDPGSTLLGAVSADGDDSTLILGGDSSETVTYTAAQYQGFPTIEFDSATATLVGSAEDLAATNETITGVAAGDSIELNDFSATPSLTSASGTLLTLSNGSATTTLSITSADAFSRFDIASANGTTTILDAACYLRGTRIRTARGDTCIENLSAGDSILTQSGALRPVKWIGTRTLDCDKHPNPQQVWPVCVSAHAFGPNLPQRDLWLSPAHAIAVEDGLIAVILLVNGITIRQHRRKIISYYHVELETHDIVLAENLPAESYLDTGNRAAFENAGADLQLHPDFRPRHARHFCRPLRAEGPQLDRARATLMQRARHIGYTETESPDLHVMADGKRIDPIMLPEGRLAIRLPEAAREIALRSRSFIPAADGINADRRTLGVCFRQVQIDGVPVSLGSDHIFQRGWHPHETSGNPEDTGWRWTDGEAAIPPGTRLLVAQINATGRYWVVAGEGEKKALLF
jgi:hypothetical protein